MIFVVHFIHGIGTTDSRVQDAKLLVINSLHHVQWIIIWNYNLLNR